MITKQEIERQQQVIRYVSQTLLSPQQTDRAVDIWETGFSGEKLFLTKILLFANQLKAELKLDVSQKEKLLRTCIEQRSLSRETLVEKIGEAVTDDSASKVDDHVDSEAPLSTEMILFNALLQEIVADTTDALQGQVGFFKASLLAELPNIDLDDVTTMSLKEWCVSIGTDDLYMLEGELTREGMSGILDVIYEVLCDELGAIEADGVLARAMHDVDKIEEARRFSVSQLF